MVDVCVAIRCRSAFLAVQRKKSTDGVMERWGSWLALLAVAAVGVLPCAAVVAEPPSGSTEAASPGSADILAKLRNADLDTLRKAATQGNAPAQAELGKRYSEGRGVTKDDQKAVYWFRKSAETTGAKQRGRLSRPKLVDVDRDATRELTAAYQRPI